MYTPIDVVSSLLFSLQITLSSAHAAPLSDSSSQYQSQQLPQRPITFSPPSQHPILSPAPPSDPSSIRGTIDVPFCPLREPIPVTYTSSSQVCPPLITEIPYIITDLTAHLLSEHINGFPFPSSADIREPLLPVYLSANITEQLYRDKFLISLSLKLLPLASRSSWYEVDTTLWRSVVGLLEHSAQEVNQEARQKNGGGLGNALVLEAVLDGVGVRADWNIWRVVDGVAVMCER